MLVGVPLGLSSRRGGKSAGFVLTIVLVFVYYFLSLTGVSLARQGKISPFLGVWAANIIFAVFGLLLLRQLSRGGVATLSHSASPEPAPRAKRSSRECRFSNSALRHERSGRRSFPLILDDYVLREFLSTFVMVLLHLRAAHARLHLLRAARRHYPQPHAAGNRRRISFQS